MAVPNRIHIGRELLVVKVWHVMVLRAVPRAIHLRQCERTCSGCVDGKGLWQRGWVEVGHSLT
eukprot:scaffold941_cov81-Phaeocystis_antarctica.AAC.4